MEYYRLAVAGGVIKIMIDPIFKQIYNDSLLDKLEKRFGSFRRCHFDMNASTQIMMDMMRKMEAKGRRGEVVMVVPNEQGHIWLHTKAFYPAGVYRLMTGGLEAGEQPHRALRREVEEETGLKTKIDRCLAVITYGLSGNDATLPFVSYVFLTTPTTGLPHPTDPDEAITAFRAVPVDELSQIAEQLRSLAGFFTDWGIFRAIAHDVARERLQAD
jgi:8-oxo-dGTP pyrophosphatase MutT (NUDIX family)